MSAALIACSMYGDTWLIYAQHLEDQLIEDPEQCFIAELLLLRVYRRCCTVYITENTFIYPMSFKFEDVAVGSQMDGPISDLLGMVVEWDNLGVRLIIIIQAVGL